MEQCESVRVELIFSRYKLVTYDYLRLEQLGACEPDQMVQFNLELMYIVSMFQ